MIEITVDTRKAVATNKELLTTGSAGIGVQFSLSADWDDLIKVAVFRNGEDENSQIDVALTDDNTCALPTENCGEQYVGEAVYAGVYGTDETGAIIIPTVWVSLGALRQGVKPGNASGSEPTPDMWAQIQAIAMNAGKENADAAELNATNAAASAEAAASSATEASASADAAAQSALQAADSALSASGSASSAEAAQTGAEAAQTAAEAAQEAAETAQGLAETAQTAAETAATSAIAAKTAAETARSRAETAKNQAVTAKQEAVMAQDSASFSEAAAELAQSRAEAAQSAAETAQGLAETAQSGAESAQAAAETAQGEAEAAQTAAETAAESIEESAAQIDQNTEDIATINSALSSLQSVTEIIDTASGAIASFPDGSGLPMRSLLAQINPVQDLHGYDAPWAGGAGVNIFDYNTFENKLITSDGVIGDSSTRLLSGIFTVTANSAYIVTYPSSGFNFAGHIEYNDSDVFQRRVLIDQTSGSTQITPATNRIRLYFSKDPNSEPISKDDLATAMVTKGTTPPDKFYPYSNECPITGWTGLSGKRDGKNLLNPDSSAWVDGKNIDASGQIIDSTSARYYRNFLKCNGGESISFQYTQTTSAAGVTCAACFYDAGMGFIERKAFFSYGETKVGLNSGTTTAPSNARYFTVIMQRNLQYTSNVQCEFSSTPTDYEAYTSLPITCTWQTEAGTVYGGTVDVVTGVLTVDREIAPWASLNWTRNTTGTYPTFNATRAKYVSDATKVVIFSSCYKGIPAVNGATFRGSDYNGCINYTNSGNLMIQDNRFDNVTDFVAFISTQQLLMYLAEPIVYQLTPQQISTLLGNNTVFVDCGAVSVTYQASIKGYIDKVLAS